MKTNFAAALSTTLDFEGGYVNNPHDPGGATNKGITLAVYREYRRNPHLTPDDIRAIKGEEVHEIYRRNYWDACRCDELPSGVDFVVFDCAVNSGVGRSSKILQEVVGTKPDGQIGPKTLEAVQKADPKLIVINFQQARQSYLESLKTYPIFGKGWSRRVALLKDIALKIA